VTVVRRRHGRHGQAIVLIALMMTLIITGIGVAIDAAVAYYYDEAAGRAAAAAALSGVIFMPNQFSSAQAYPAGSGNDASDRAIAEARRNGFDMADTADNVQVTPSAVTGNTDELQVTVSRNVATLLLGIIGIRQYSVQRTAIAQYLPPIQLGQSGSQVGSTVSQLGTSGFYFLRTEGSATDRGEGDAFTPANSPAGGCAACPSNDVHALSQLKGTDLADTSLPAQGGYNYRVVVPPGATATVEVYNAAFAPDDNSGQGGPGPNYCENAKPGTSYYACSPGGNYYMHETDCCAFNYSDPTTYSTMEYTLFSEPNEFTPSSDVKLSQMIVDPLDARNWNQAKNNYTDVRTGNVITQKYYGYGAPHNGLAYHAWLDIAGFRIDPNDDGMISYTPGYGPLSSPLGPGQYRLRIDTLEWDGTNPPSDGTAGASYAHKGLAVRVMDGTGSNPCTTCSIAALKDFAIYTPIALAGGGSFQMPLFQLPPDYAGKTISIGIFDIGDMSGTGNIYVGFINPVTNALLDLTGTGTTASVYDDHTQLSNSGTSAATLIAQPTVVEQIATSGTNFYADNRWYEFDIPVPATYNPGTNPANWWWKLQYRTTGGVTATDTITVTVGLKGNPVHLVSG
jgi:hypothetical protein